MTRAKAVRIACDWAACGMPGCDSSLYQFASWDGRVCSEEHRRRCSDAIHEHLCWVLAHRRQIASGKYPEHNLDEFAELVSLEQFILSAHLRP